MVPSLFICSECKEIEEDRTNVATCAECGVGSEFRDVSVVSSKFAIQVLTDTTASQPLLLLHRSICVVWL